MPALPRFSARLRRSGPPARLRFDGQTLLGDAAARTVEVAVPARLASFRREEFPAAADTVLRAAIRLRAERAFAALGPVAIDALIGPPVGGKRAALLVALPLPVVAAVRHAAQARNRSVTAIRIAELLPPVPAGGVVVDAGEACLIALDGDAVRAIAVLGRTDAPGFDALLQRERLRLDVAADAPAGVHGGAAIDFVAPALHAATPLLVRPAVRLGILAAGVAVAAVLAVAVIAGDALAERAAAQAELARLKPLSGALSERRADLKELAGWFDDRPALAPGLHALAAALPAPDSPELVRLVRVRQQVGVDAVAEGVAGDRAQLMAFLGRLRRDARIASAEVRTFRSLTKGSEELGFELVFRLAAGAAAAGKAGAHATT